MIALKLDEILIALISIMQLLSVVGLNEVILSTCSEQSWNKRVFNVIYRRQFINVKVYF